MGWDECTTDRNRRCLREEDRGHYRCTEERDEGYDECSESRDEGYKDCCEWFPCNLACDAWTWISNIVCVAWTWISNIVCVVWAWIRKMVCVIWDFVTAPACLLLGRNLTRSLDNIFDAAMDGLEGFVSGLVHVIRHPLQFIKLVISLFQGCPDVTADAKQTP